MWGQLATRCQRTKDHHKTAPWTNHISIVCGFSIIEHMYMHALPGLVAHRADEHEISIIIIITTNTSGITRLRHGCDTCYTCIYAYTLNTRIEAHSESLLHGYNTIL